MVGSVLEVGSEVIGDPVGADVAGDLVGSGVAGDCVRPGVVGDLVGPGVVGDLVGAEVGPDVAGDPVGTALDGMAVGMAVGEKVPCLVYATTSLHTRRNSPPSPGLVPGMSCTCAASMSCQRGLAIPQKDTLTR